MQSRTIELLLQRIAGSGVTSSTARGQGPAGTMIAAVKFLYSPAVIAKFNAAESATSFYSILNIETEGLREVLPCLEKEDGTFHGKHWGSARKFLNIFLLDCTLNRQLCDYYKNLASLEHWLEVPLDRIVGECLTQEPENISGRFCLAWNTIKGLSEEESARYQQLAQLVADRKRMPRVHLDLLYLAYPEQAAL